MKKQIYIIVAMVLLVLVAGMLWIQPMPEKEKFTEWVYLGSPISETTIEACGGTGDASNSAAVTLHFGEAKKIQGREMELHLYVYKATGKVKIDGNEVEDCASTDGTLCKIVYPFIATTDTPLSMLIEADGVAQICGKGSTYEAYLKEKDFPETYAFI